jgi:hypothetical protein
MNRIGLTLFTAAMVAASAAAQTQSGAQGGAQSSAQASADAGKQGAEASGSGSATASGAAQVGQNSNSTSLAGGSTFNAVLRAPLDSKKCKPGDAVNARTTEPAKSDGKTVFPKGTKLVGHVTQASARGKGDSESALGIVFDKAILKNGEEVPVNVAIQAIASAETGARAAGSDIDTMGGLGTSTAGSGTAGGRGALGGVTSAAGGTAGTVTNTAANAGGTTRGALNAAGQATGSVASTSSGATGGLDAAGQLASNSQGVFGLNGLNLSSATSNSTQGSLITSAGKNVHLDSGTQMLLVSQAESAPQGESKQPKSDKSLPKSQSQSRSDKPNQK